MRRIGACGVLGLWRSNANDITRQKKAPETLLIPLGHPPGGAKEHYFLGAQMAKDKPAEAVQANKIGNYAHPPPQEDAMGEQMKQAPSVELGARTMAESWAEIKGSHEAMLVNIDTMAIEVGPLGVDFLNISKRVSKTEGHVTELQQEVANLKKTVTCAPITLDMSGG
ncbi:hypothetical protein NDU88_002708 [Pleurodeles waltl]|uniref:Uncharacterized protein n=1 Tax=Pleurodeles waltl TaxID=8319 RepID=A0AAV7Q7G2_PLEWA|nr:hypothetical protein NDU88_002708 [Pleurodeles waltl]